MYIGEIVVNCRKFIFRVATSSGKSSELVLVLKNHLEKLRNLKKKP